MARTNVDTARQSLTAWRQPRAFTLVELLVVIAIISLLVGLLVPTLGRSVRQARSTVCKSNLKDLYRALDIYRTENFGWLPTVDASTAFRSAESWPARLFARHPGGAGVLICPDDPWAPIMRDSLLVSGFALIGNASYGLNDFIVSSPESYLAQLDRFRPRQPDSTILLADMGPDVITSGTGSGHDDSSLDRNYGRLSIDDGYRPGEPPNVSETLSWVTGRHLGRINVLSLIGNVKEVNVVPVISRPIVPYYPDCAAQYCTMCVELDVPHYSFAESGAFWWTGPLPRR